MKFKAKVRIFFKSIHNNIRVNFMSNEDIRKETMFFIVDNYRLRRLRVSNNERWGNREICDLFIDELYEVLHHIPKPTYIDKDMFLLRSECLFNLYNDIQIIRGDILGDDICIDLQYIKEKYIQYGGRGNENI